MHDRYDSEREASAERPSKSELKRRSAGLQDLGESLIGLPQAELDALPLPEKLRDAVELARRISKRGGLYRQRQYIGKLMRQTDVEPIRAALAARRAEQRRAAAEFKRFEQWRDGLISGDPEVLPALLAAYPQADGDMLTQLATQARHEKASGGPPRAARRIFTELRRLVASATG